jgi:hypothetical protein
MDGDSSPVQDAQMVSGLATRYPESGQRFERELRE